MPRVCHVTTSHKVGDVRIFRRECRGLARLGYDVHLIAEAPAETELDNVKIHPLPALNGLGRKFILPRVAIQKALDLKPDLVHIHDPGLLPWGHAAVRSRGAKIVWDAHELYTATLKEFHFRPFPPLGLAVSRVFDRVERKWCRAFAGAIGVTDPITARYASMGIPAVTIRNVVDLDGLPTPRVPKTAAIFTVLSSGTTSEGRRVRQLFDAFAILRSRVPNCCLRLLACYDTAEEERQIREYIVDRGLAGNVRVSPTVPWETLMAEEIPRADLAVVFYARTKNNLAALPNRLFEYWADAVPTLATDTPLLSELFRRYPGGRLLNSDSAETIAEALWHYYQRPEEARRDGEIGRRAVTEVFNWAAELKKLDAFYRDILT